MESESSRRAAWPVRDSRHTEATRLLCAGARLSTSFRTRVIDELVGQAQRPVAPSYGADVLPVLAHALGARREEARTALLLLAVWVGFLVSDAVMTWDAVSDAYGGAYGGDSPLSAIDLPLLLFRPEAVAGFRPDVQGPGLVFTQLSWALSYAVVVVLLWFARQVSGSTVELPAALRKAPLPGSVKGVRKNTASVLRLLAGLLAVLYGYAAVRMIADTPYPVIFPLLIAVVVWWHRSVHQRSLRASLSRRSFAEAEPPRLAGRYAHTAELIQREQRASLTLYDPHRPFVGAGTTRKPWLVVLELQPRGGEDTEADGEEAKTGPAPGPVPAPRAAGEGPSGHPSGGPGTLTARDVIEMIEPKLRALRTSTAATSKDRLQALEIEEFVYLPSGVGRDELLHTADGAPPRPIHDAAQVARHLAESLGEGGEARRHFLRVRVGAWDEQVVVSLLVRVHTQGGMLVLEVVPHVLGPIIAEFRAVDALVEAEPAGPLRDGIGAALASPMEGMAIGIGALRTLRSELRLRLAPPRLAAPDAPSVSLRELVSTDELSLLQEMDVTRYIRTLQDRIGEGVRDALHARGYRTDRLEQNITTINSSLYIGEMSGGAVATGTHGMATHREGSTA
ncbi:hypothetical protein [Streptomyces sp. TS71-3]|uniref:hypothetical protein n=1 Tax=Streptomyces sp. TS71-3 TaxID=2733862 RepID=UPI001B2AE9D8|nr:hypothetical protein [Streptomyces sp. TS71-3]GHJ35098.1 hypothetical protein Sm713_07070 [Streptomyces sp. TS71-3]